MNFSESEKITDAREGIAFTFFLSGLISIVMLKFGAPVQMQFVNSIPSWVWWSILFVSLPNIILYTLMGGVVNLIKWLFSVLLWVKSDAKPETQTPARLTTSIQRNGKSAILKISSNRWPRPDEELSVLGQVVYAPDEIVCDPKRNYGWLKVSNRDGQIVVLE